MNACFLYLRFLERQGLLERDVENSYLSEDAVDDDLLARLLGNCITSG
ncbi:hypothetical protein [Marinobacter sp. ELB17]|nr:hypothetical protein [Marinobacter sp. ELB17]